MWEPDVYKAFIENGKSLEIEPEEDAPAPSMRNLTTIILDELRAETAERGYVPDTVSYHAYMVVALHVSMNIEWDPTSDLLASRLIGT